MKISKLTKLFSIALLTGAFCIPLAGCGVEDEPVGVEPSAEEEAEMESEEYLEGEEGT